MEGDVELTNEIKEYMIERGVDMVGIAPVKRFDNGPEETHPGYYMPDATHVISMGMKINDGSCDVWGEWTEPGKTISPYLFYGYGLLNLEMSSIGNLASKRMLEERGYKALMFPPTWSIGQYRYVEQNYNTEYVTFLHDFSHRHAAVAAGLGEFGFNGLVLVPNYGARVRFNSIITNAPLVPDPMYSGTELCQRDRCNYKCVSVCPTEALTKDETFTVDFGEKVYEYSKSDKVRCIMAIFAMVKGTGARTEKTMPPRGEKKYTMDDFWKGFESNHYVDKGIIAAAQGIICGDYCGKCLHQCPAYTFDNKRK